MSIDPNRLAECEARFQEIARALKEADGLSPSTLDSIQEILALGRDLERGSEAIEIAGQCLASHATSEPHKTIATATKIVASMDGVDHDGACAFFDHVLAIAYLALGDAVRATQHRTQSRRAFAKVMGLGSFAALAAAVHFGATRLAEEPAFAVPPSIDLADWLSGKSAIGLSDLGERFGDFVSNDKNFHRQAVGRLKMLHRRLEAKLAKPDNYLLEAEPGSGKSFFVKQFKSQLAESIGRDVIFLERNLSAYGDIDQAFTDIVLDVLIALAATRDVLLFIDEVDTRIDHNHIFQKLIAPMNGDPFFFLQKEVSFASQNLAVFYALSGKREVVSSAAKWPDFLSRIPPAHRIALPDFGNPIERIYRVIGLLSRGTLKVGFVETHALLYIGWTDWASSRELQQAVELARARMAPDDDVLELAHLATDEDVRHLGRSKNVDIYDIPNHQVRIGP